MKNRTKSYRVPAASRRAAYELADDGGIRTEGDVLRAGYLALGKQAIAKRKRGGKLDDQELALAQFVLDVGTDYEDRSFRAARSLHRATKGGR